MMMNRSIRLLDLIEVVKLDDFLKSFTRVTGVAAIIADTSGQPVTRAHNFSSLCQHFCRSSEEGRNKCWESDSYGGQQSAKQKKRFIYKCLNAGLIDSAYPIIVDGYHLATALCGQVLFEPIAPDVAVERASSIGVEDVDGYLRELEKIPIMVPDQFEGIVGHMRVVTQTISELALEKNLSKQRSRQYLNKLINSVSDGIISTNNDATISIINDGCARMFGYEKKALIGKSLYSLFVDDTAIKNCQEQIALSQQQDCRSQLVAVNAQKEHFPLQISISRFKSDAYRNSGYVAVLRDISEEKKIEQMKEDLIGMMTHDMGNPVLSIQKGIQLMVDGTLGPLNQSQMEIMNLALSTSQKLYGMVSDFLDIYRNENGNFLLCKLTSNFVRVINEGVDYQRLSALDRQVSVKVQLPMYPIIMECDRNRLIRTFSNLLDNAIKYSPKKGQVHISAAVLTGREIASKNGMPGGIKAAAFSRERYHLLINITDHGPGIAKKDQQHIFKKFYTARAGKNRGRKGLGLGLCFCKLVIEAHNGHIWVTSPVEQSKNRCISGSRFSIALPI